MTGYQRLNPGKQEINVNRRGGVYFSKSNFDNADFKVKEKDHFIDYVVGQIKKHNNIIDEWRTKTKALEKKDEK